MPIWVPQAGAFSSSKGAINDYLQSRKVVETIWGWYLVIFGCEIGSNETSHIVVGYQISLQFFAISEQGHTLVGRLLKLKASGGGCSKLITFPCFRHCGTRSALDLNQ